jgi:MFS family permease
MGHSSSFTANSDAGSDVNSEPSATTPLLHSGNGNTNTTAHDHEHEHHHHDRRPDTPTIHHHHKRHPKFLKVVFIVLASLFFISIGDYMNRAPWMRIQEDIVCRAYYRHTFPHEFEGPFDPIPEDRCKVPDVQSKLAMLRGWDQTLSCIPSIFTAVPYGVIADKYGRKLVLVLSLVGIILSVSWAEAVGYFSHYIAIEWFWAGNAFLLIGGGSVVARATFFTILADVASEEVRWVDLHKTFLSSNAD